MQPVHYLSEEWIQAADAAVKLAAATAPIDAVTIDQHVEGAVDYRVTIGRDDCSIVMISPNEPSTADASFSQDSATAQAVAQGTTDAHQAFLLGHIRFVGNINVLIERRDAFAWLQAALAPVLADTVFAEPV